MFRTQTNFTLLTILLSFFLRVEALTEEYFDDEAKKVPTILQIINALFCNSVQSII